MTATRVPAARADRLPTGEPARLPGLARVGVARGVVEVKQFFREKQAWTFTLALPALLLLLFGSVFRDTMGDAAGQFFLPTLMAFSIMSTSFTTLAVGIAVDRDDSTLKRLRGTPMPAAGYFIGKVLLVLVTGLAAIALMLLIATVVFGVDLRLSPGRWATFAWVVLLGMTSFALLGTAVSSLAGSGRNAGAVVNLPFLLLQFVSGVFIPFQQLPDGVQAVGSLFPAKWFAQGMQSVFLPDAFLAVAPYDTWQRPTTAVILSAWCVAGLVLCSTTFRWTR